MLHDVFSAAVQPGAQKASYIVEAPLGGVLKGHCHAIWQLYRKLEGVFALACVAAGRVTKSPV